MADPTPPPLDDAAIASEAELLDPALREARPVAPSTERVGAAGEFVIPGSVAAALPFAAGETLRARFASLGELAVPVV